MALAEESLARGGNVPAPLAFFRTDPEREGLKLDPPAGMRSRAVPKALCWAVPVPPVATLLGAECAGCRLAGDGGGVEGRVLSGAGLRILQPLPEAFVETH